MATVYMNHPTKTSTPAYTFGGKKSQSAATLPPGPGNYDPAKPNKNISVGIGTAQRGANLKESPPGPGQYEPKDKKWLGPAFTCRPKTAGSQSKMRNPGPGTHTPNMTHHESRPMYTFGGKAPRSKNEQSPGPGTYESKPRPTSAVRIGTGQRYKRDPDKAPGPGTYEFVQYDKPVNPNYKFGTMVRSKSGGLARVGPGSYESKTNFNPGNSNSKAISMTPRRKDLAPKYGQVAPGPGKYESIMQGTKQIAPNYSIGKQQRINASKSQQNLTTGPGKYEIPSHTGIQYAIGNSTREKAGHDKLNTPGPGTYEYSGTNQAPQYSMRKKGSQTARQGNPGPGTYENKPNDFATPIRGPTYRFGSGERTARKKKGVPGPGTYESTLAHRTTDPQWKFGTAKKSSGKIKKTEPGFNYDIAAAVPNVPKYLLSNTVASRQTN